jgi:hypothetical protein
MAKKRAAKAERNKIVTPEPTTRNGQVVEITGPAKVDATDEIGTTKSDHQGAVARVEGHYYSEERGCQMATVRTEDNKVRVIPEDRLTDIDEAVNSQAGTRKGARVGPLGISQDRFEEIFGKRDRTPSSIRPQKDSDE